jgi:hypothetical protein
VTSVAARPAERIPCRAARPVGPERTPSLVAVSEAGDGDGADTAPGAARPDHDEIDAESDAERAAARRAGAERQLLADANALARDNAMRARGRKLGGTAGAALAAAMIAIRDVYEGRPKDDGSVVVDAPTEPEDLDRDGLALGADEIGGANDVAVPALPRRAPVVARRTSRRRR